MPLAVDLLEACGEPLDFFFVVLRVECFQVLFDDGQLGLDRRRVAEDLSLAVSSRWFNSCRRSTQLARSRNSFRLAAPAWVNRAPNDSREPRSFFRAWAAFFRWSLRSRRVRRYSSRTTPNDLRSASQAASTSRAGFPSKSVRPWCLPASARRRVEGLDCPFVMAILVAGRRPGPQVVAGLGDAVPRVECFVDLDCFRMSEILEQLAPGLPLRTEIALHTLEPVAQLRKPAATNA